MRGARQSHTRTVPSAPALARWRPSGANATALTEPRWPRRTVARCPRGAPVPHPHRPVVAGAGQVAPVGRERHRTDEAAVAAQDELWGRLAGGESEGGLGEVRVFLGVRLPAEGQALGWVVGQFAQSVGGEEIGLGGVPLVGRPTGLDERNHGERAHHEQGGEETSERAARAPSFGGLFAPLSVAAGG